MVKILTIVLLFSPIINYGQSQANFRSGPPGGHGLTWQYAGFSSHLKAERVDSCGPDTLKYAASKNTVLEWYIMNNASSSATFNSAYAQYYDAPQDMVIYGACFYGFMDQAGQTAVVDVSLYTAANDSFPMTELATGSVTVNDTYSATDLSQMQYCVSFSSPVTVTGSYLIVIRTATTQDLLILANSYSNSDGAGEGLSFAYYSDSLNFPSYVGWYDQLEPPYSWDFDWLLEPVVKYQFQAALAMDPAGACEGDTVCVINQSDSIMLHRMYNQNAPSDPFVNTVVDFGNGHFTTGEPEPCAVYSTAGTFATSLTDEIMGWTVACQSTGISSVLIDADPVAGFTFQNTSGTSVLFSSTSMFADSLHWVFDSGFTTSDSSFNHTFANNDTAYVTLYAYNSCGVDSLTQTIVPGGVSVSEFALDAVKLYPNPAVERINLSGSFSGTIRYEIFDATGQLITTGGFVGSTQINLSGMAAGVYTIRLVRQGEEIRKIFVRN